MDEKILAIAIDLGAANTGVYSAFYNKGTQLEDLEHKQGKVYDLSKDAYTLLMNNRTVKRHQRRGIDRKQLVKRLFKLIWIHQLKLEWSDNIQQSISFLLNRRGFSFLTEQYNTEVLANTPNIVIKILPKCLKPSDDDAVFNGHENVYNLNLKLGDLSKHISKLNSTISEIRKNIFLSKIKKICQHNLTTPTKYMEGKNEANKLSQLAKDDFHLIKSYLVNINSIELDQFSYTNQNGEIKQSRYYWNNKYDILKFINEKYDKSELQQVIDKITPLELDDVWNFNPDSKFDFDNEKNLQALEDNNVQAHLHHLTFALYNIKNELESGSRHRCKYFEEIKSVLSATNHQEPYLKEFCTKLHNRAFNNLNNERLTNLIGNLSNLELKPLRKYFNDKQHTKSDYWSESRLTDIYSHWILNEWRVGSKDKDKQQGKIYCYKSLCQELKRKINITNSSIIELLMELDPCKTIPPYQDNNNRNPPKCQSLILNPQFLDSRYPKWEDCLSTLKNLQGVKEYLGNYINEMQTLKTSKEQLYFVDTKHINKQISSGQRDKKDLNARILQFLFDRIKANDDLLLNEIYSLAKKIKQNTSSAADREEYTQKLNKALCNSNLPDSLKSKHNNGVFLQGEFLHLVCKYFKYRQRARDSRVYIMPEYKYDRKYHKWNNTGRFDENNHLLTYCNHKPRQKRYQLLNDLAGVFQVSPTILREKIGSEQESDIINWLKEFKLTSYCKSAVEMQKLYRGSLKQKIDNAIFKNKIENIRKNKKTTDEEKSLLTKYGKTTKPNKEEENLAKLVNNINDASQKIGASLGLDDTQMSKFNSIYSFAQIHQIVFVERTGNSSTCPVCSLDNAHRMQIVNDGAKAQRLAAVPTRIIDGAVKKMATILAKNIVNDNWYYVKRTLSNNQNIHIPIITESNAFEFEPNLALIKGTKLKNKRKKLLENSAPEMIFENRDERIKNDSLNISAYSGDELSKQTELDHIIPRSSQYGVLNDEANLICVNQADNQRKGNQQYYLANLADNYKQAIFGTNNNHEIEDWISNTIWNRDRKDFKFGNYYSFINLSHDEQKAFRHALFLTNDNEIKQAVIKAINNRNRTFVNGTQRYFAEVIANTFYLRAKQEKLNPSKISFDYFGVETTNHAGTGIANIRKFYEDYDYANIAKYKKEGNKQEPYSHLIDAMFAFCIAINSHKNDGSMGIKINNENSLLPVDSDYGEIFKDIFSQIRVTKNQFEAIKLARRKAYTVETNIRQEIESKGDFKKSIPYKIHKDSLSAEKYFPILQLSEDKWKYGFTLDNSNEIAKKDIELIQEFLTHPKAYNGYSVWLINKTQAQDYLMNIGYSGANEEQKKIAKVLDRLAYKSIKKDISNILTKGNKTPENVSEALEVFDELVFKKDKDKFINFVKSGILLPFYNDWKKLQNAMQKADAAQKLHDFLSNHFASNCKENEHQKVRKNYSLPIISTIGSIRLRRKSWNGKNIYQVTGDESLAKYGFDAESIPNTILSKNSVPVEHYSGVEKENLIEPLKWINIKLHELNDNTIVGARIINRSAGQVTINVELSSLDNICLKQENWSGSIVYSEPNDETNIIKGDKFYINKENFYWLKDFPLLFDRGKTKATLSIRKIGSRYILEFVSSKGKKEKGWLKNETPNN